MVIIDNKMQLSCDILQNYVYKPQTIINLYIHKIKFIIKI
jgi:hypothetical protein